MTDSVMVIILILQTLTFVMSDPRNFTFIGLIPEEMLVKVPSNNDVVNAYPSLSSSAVRLMSDDLRNLIYEGNKLKMGGKRKAKAATSKVVKAPKKSRKPAKKPRSLSPVLQEDSE